jgi:ubiquinol-cytochrome c reductase cytochrome c1 subunit
MPPPLSAPDLVHYDDGTNASVDQMATDVVTFLQWADDPHMVARKRLGMEVIAYLIVLSLLMYGAYKAVWRGESH